VGLIPFLQGDLGVGYWTLLCSLGWRSEAYSVPDHQGVAERWFWMRL
jgi:hypothetical protein